jgi:hypothetical protein
MQWSNAYNCVAFPYRNIIKTELEAVANPIIINYLDPYITLNCVLV